MVENDLLPLLRERLRGKFASPLTGVSASILLTAGSAWNYTINIDSGRLSAELGAPNRPTTRVYAPMPTLRDVVDGTRSGIEAFIAGELVVRGNMSLALQLDGLFLDDEHAHPERTRTRRVQSEGVDTFFIEAGDPDAPTVVLVHGLGATNASMLPLLVALAPRFRVLAPDLPGHGGSGESPAGYRGADLGRWLATFLGATTGPGRRAVIVGNSLGGRAAIEAALLTPRSVRGLVLLCPALTVRRLRQFVPVIRLLRPELANVPLPVTVPRLMAQRAVRSLFADPSSIPDPWYDAAIDEFNRVISMRTGRVAFLSATREIYLDQPAGNAGFWSRLPQLRTPALFVWGAQDPLVSARTRDDVTVALPHAQTRLLDQCGHLPQFELPGPTAALVETFIGGLAD